MWPFRKKRRPVWMNRNGQIACHGDDCPQKECDDTCPIWCNTKMIALAQIEQFEKAIEWGEKAIDIAPDAADFWNNLASVYGQDGNHRKARECYLKALELRPRYPAALTGLKIAESHLGLTNGGYTEEDVKDVLRIANALPEEAYKYEFFPYPSLPFVPELMDYLNHVPHTILDDLNEYYAKEEKSSVYEHLETAVAWGFFAGLGAVEFWHQNWPELEKKGIMAMIYEHASIFDLDEFVFKTIYGASSDKEIRKLHRKFRPLCQLVITKFSSKEIRSNSAKTLLKMVQVAFLLGCAYRLHEIGMH